MKVIIFGGGGFIGSNLIEILASNPRVSHITLPLYGDNIKLAPKIAQLIQAGNKPAKKSPHASPKLNCIAYNPLAQDSVNQAIDGHDIVINLIGILHQYNKFALQELVSKILQLPDRKSHKDERDAMRNFEFTHNKLVSCIAEACKKHKSHLVHISAQGADPKSPCKYLTSKGRGEEHVRAIKNWTLVRPGLVLGEDAMFVKKMQRLSSIFPIMPLPLATSRQQPIDIKDLIDLLNRIIDKPQEHNQAVIDAVGAKEMTMSEIIKQIAKPRWIIPLPAMMNLHIAIGSELVMRNPIITRDNLRAVKAYKPVAKSHTQE